MDTEVLVYVDLDGAPQLAGRLWARVRKGRDSATFEYDKDWLANPLRFSLEPALQLGPGPFHTPVDKPLFGAIGDSPPIGGGVCSCAVPNAGVRGQTLRRRAGRSRGRTGSTGPASG